MRQRHGLKKTRLYRIWLAMKNRCFNAKTMRYPDYGGRGIVVCSEWKNDFKSFYDWSMSHGYDDSLSIDRIDNDGNYEPSNCRWATQLEQVRNSRHCNYLTHNGETHPISEWSEITKITVACIRNRLRYGWSVEKTLTTPMRKNKNRLFEKGMTQ